MYSTKVLSFHPAFYSAREGQERLRQAAITNKQEVAQKATLSGHGPCPNILLPLSSSDQMQFDIAIELRRKKKRGVF